jgi:hypothetical protein
MRKDGVLLAVLLCLAALCAPAQNPSPTRGTLTGTLPGPSVNGAIDPAQFAGSDIGAQINAAFAACTGNSIHLQIPPGRYSFSTPVAFSGSCVPQIDAAGVEMDYTGTGQAITFSGLNISGSFGAPKYLRGLHLVYTGTEAASVTGIAIGDTSGSRRPACCGTGIRLEDDWIENFGIDLLFGSNAWNFSAIGSYFSADTNGKLLVSFPATATNSGESLRFTNSTFFSTGAFLTNAIDIANGAVSSSWDGDNFNNVEVELVAGNNNMSSPYWENPSAAIPPGHFFLVAQATGALFNPFFAPNMGWAGRAPFYMASISGNWSADGSQGSGAALPSCAAFYRVTAGARFTLTGTRDGCRAPFVAANGAMVTAILSEAGNAATIAGASPQINMLALPDAAGRETTPAIVMQNGSAKAAPRLGIKTETAASGTADGDGLIYTFNGSSYQNHILFHNGNAPFSVAETEIVQPSFFDSAVGFNSGILSNSPGFKHVRVASTCITAAALGSTCTFTVELPGGAFADTSFTSTCTGVGVTTGVAILTVHAVTTSQLTLQIQAASAAAASIAGADCIAIHD